MKSRILPAVVLTGLLAAAPAGAHKVSVFAVAENGVVTGEGYFSGGAKAQNSTVEIRNASGEVIAQGTTGEDGTFRIALPQGAGAPLTVLLKAGEGHQGDFTLTGEDLGRTGADAASGPAPSSALAGPATATTPPLGTSPDAPPAKAALGGLDESRLAALVEAATAKAVEEKTAPLKLELAKLTGQADGARLQGIVGGLGWIVGLVGLAAWFKRPKE